MNVHISFATILISSFICCAAYDQATQSIEVVNNSNQPLHIATNGREQLLRLEYEVPARYHSLIVATLTKLQSPQEFLYAAILNDSAAQILQAVRLGANLNQEIDGYSPLLLAATLKRYNAISCLLDLGAR